MVKDRIGNELKDGHLVEIKLGSPEVMAYITEVKSGGIIAGLRKGSGESVTPGIVTLVATFTFQFDPTNPVLANVIRLTDPSDKATTPLLN
jgi:hypothetical protein